MRRSLLYISLLIFAVPMAASAQIRGAWSALVKGDRVHLNMTRANSNWGRTLPRTDFAISEDAITSATETPVHFALNRDAGTIDFTGTSQSGEGVGRFSFTPNHSYVATLQSLGVSTASRIDDEDLFSLAMHDVSIAFIRDMQSLGYRENLDQYVAFRIHGVTGESSRAIKELGVKDLSAGQLVAMRIHGVSTEYVRELRDLGYTALSSDDLVSMRIHGVSTRFIRELATAGYHNIPVGKLVEMKIHGIDASMLRLK